MQRCIQWDTAAPPSANTRMHTRTLTHTEFVDMNVSIQDSGHRSRCFPRCHVCHMLDLRQEVGEKEERRCTWNKTRAMEQKRKKKDSCVCAECLFGDTIHQIPDSLASLRSSTRQEMKPSRTSRHTGTTGIVLVMKEMRHCVSQLSSKSEKQKQCLRQSDEMTQEPFFFL